MKNKIFKSCIFIIITVVLLTFAAMMSSADAVDPSAATSGRCGKRAYWEYDTATATLRITGEGTMIDYEFGNSEWHEHCKTVKTIDIEEGITYIGNYAFYDFGALTTVNMPDSLTSIGKDVFMYCTSMKTITLPKNLKTMGMNVFEGCSSLREIVVSADSKYYSSVDGVLFNKNKSKILKYPPAKSGTSYSIPVSVGEIESAAFLDCKKLTTVSIPNTVTYLGSSVFSGCTSLSTIYIPNGVKELPACTFQKCSSLKSVILGRNITYIGDSAFSDCVSLPMIKIPAKVTRIEGWAFYNCRSMTYAIVPGGLVFLGKQAFDECPRFTDVYFGGGKNEWNALNFGEYNERYLNATKHYYVDMSVMSCFYDVPTNAWFTTQVIWCCENGYMSGTAATSFSPNTQLTRAMVVQILAKMCGVDLNYYVYSGKFKDVKANDWFAKAVQWAVTNNITGGTSETTFSPNAPVTREQLAMFFFAYAKLFNFDTSASTGLGQYKDAGQVSSWAIQALKWAVAKALISGTSSNTITPKGNATRAQAAVIFKNFITSH